MEIKTEVVLEFKNHRIHLTTGELKQLRDFIDRQIAYLAPHDPWVVTSMTNGVPLLEKAQ